jgi:molybdopterin converting factor small subunit
MKVMLLAFATAAERLGWRSREVEAESTDTPRMLFERVSTNFQPGTARVAVDCVYHEWDAPIGDSAKEVAIIPPVSGG